MNEIEKLLRTAQKIGGGIDVSTYMVVKRAFGEDEQSHEKGLSVIAAAAEQGLVIPTFDTRSMFLTPEGRAFLAQGELQEKQAA